MVVLTRGRARAFLMCSPQRKLMLIGTAEVEHAAVADDLERSKRTQRFIASDHNRPPLPKLPPAPPPSRRHRASDGPVHANRGGGIYLNPEVRSRDHKERLSHSLPTPC